MSNTLFRKKSLERISSPEQLNDYIRVSTPSVWMVLLAVVVLLVGVCVWGVTGHMDTVLPVAALAREGSVVAYVQEGDAAALQEGMTVTVGGVKGTVKAVSTQPVRVDESFDDYLLHVGGLQTGEWVYAVTLDVACADGVHSAEIVTESVSPLSFVLN